MSIYNICEGKKTTLYDSEDLMSRQVRDLTEPELNVTIQNIFATVVLGHDLDLNNIVKSFAHVDYRPERFPGLVFRLKKPKTTILIFSSGKMVCTGAKSEKMARRAVNKVMLELKASGIIVKSEPKIAIKNIVASVDLKGEINLESLIFNLKRIMYEPEQFPAAVYRMEDPNVVFLIFTNGKLTSAGAKKEEDVYEAVDKLKRSLEEYNMISYKLSQVSS